MVGSHDSEPFLEEIAKAIASGDAVFFVGAGLSAGAGAPLWADLAKRLREQLHPMSDEESPLQIAQYFRNQHGNRKLFSLLRDVIHQHELLPSATHQILASISQVLVTTNYDDLIEQSFREAGRPLHVITEDHELGLWDESKEAQLIKVHGDLNRPDSIVLSSGDYMRFMRRNTLIQRKLHDIFCYRTVVFSRI